MLYIILYYIILYIILCYPFIKLNISISFDQIKIFVPKYQIIYSSQSPLLESEDWPLHRGPQEYSLLPFKR